MSLLFTEAYLAATRDKQLREAMTSETRPPQCPLVPAGDRAAAAHPADRPVAGPAARIDRYVAGVVAGKSTALITNLHRWENDSPTLINAAPGGRR